jgi:hypothetical protein
MDLNDVIGRLQRLEPQEFQWLSADRQFDALVPDQYIEAWIKNTKESMALEAYALGRAMCTAPSVLKEQGGGGTGVRIRALTLPMLSED